MHVEVSVALNFVISYLYNKLPRRRVDCFGEELEKALKKKFEGHWYPDKPFKGSGFRCIRISGEIVDPVMEVAATASGLLNEEIQEYLPADLTVWIDPCEVSYRIGEKGIVKVLYSNREEIQPEDTGLDHEIQSVSRAFNPEAQCFKPIDSLSSSLSNLSVSPSSPGSGSPNGTGSMTTSTSPNTPYVPRQSGPPLMTTAMFAQTKFGSTKLKSQVKRPARLSPTEFSSYLKQRAALQAAQGVPPNFAAMPPMPRPPSVQPVPVGPRDHRADFIEHQHRLMLAHQFGQSLCSPVGGSPLGGSLNDLYGEYQVAAVANQQHVSYPDILASAMTSTRPIASQQQQQQQLAQQQLTQQQQQQQQQGAPSPDAPNKTFLDNLNSLPPYASLQHLLVAN